MENNGPSEKEMKNAAYEEEMAMAGKKKGGQKNGWGKKKWWLKRKGVVTMLTIDYE